MRKIVVSIQNGLLAEALTQLLSASGAFEPYRTAVDKNKRAVAACVACNADLVLMEVTHTAHTSLEARLQEGPERSSVPMRRLTRIRMGNREKRRKYASAAA